MGRGRITDYIGSHFIGRQPLTWSFFVNGVAFYVFVVGAGLTLNWGLSRFGAHLNVGAFIVLFCMTWSLVGNVAAAVRTIRLRHSGWQIVFAIIVLGNVLVVTIGLIDDLFHILIVV